MSQKFWGNTAVYYFCLYFRSYQPYVFQPNFLKQQIRQREVEKALQLGENASSIQLTLRNNNSGVTGNPMTLPLNVVEEMMNRKKTGRKVIDWTPSCALYLEVSYICCNPLLSSISETPSINHRPSFII